MTVRSTLPLLTEGEEYLVTSPFGRRRDPLTGSQGVRHDGIDLVLWRGYGALSAVGAAWDGIVSCVSYDASRGNYVIIDHGEGVETHCYHLADGSVAVSLGDHVAAGQTVGRMGSTGASTGAHLHFQLEIHGEPVDPLPYITGERVPPFTPADNEPSDWSADAVRWACDNGILYGDGGGNLMLRQPCTREQMVVFLYRVYNLVTGGQT